MNTYEVIITTYAGERLRPQQYKAVSDDALRDMLEPKLRPGYTLAVKLVAIAPGPRVTIDGLPDENYTVEEASRFLTCQQPVPLALLSKLGKDCSMVCRIQGGNWTERATPAKQWQKERAYPPAIIREVFSLNPATAPYIPK